MSAPVRHTWRAAVVQFCATADAAANLETCRGLLRAAKGQGAEFAFFPEASDFVSPSNADAVRLAHQAAGGFLAGLADEAKRLGVWVGVGVHEKVAGGRRVSSAPRESPLPPGFCVRAEKENEGEGAALAVVAVLMASRPFRLLRGRQAASDPARVYNSHMLISGTTGEEKAELVATRTLSSVGSGISPMFTKPAPRQDIEGGPRLVESDSTARGESIVDPVPTPFGNIGLAICYGKRDVTLSAFRSLQSAESEDLRFPELSQALRRRGAHVLAYPSAFTVATGEAHWEALLRARAIETQTYVIAAAQIVASCPARGTAPSVAVADISYAELDRVRRAMTVLQHRRVDIFPEPVPVSKTTVGVAEGDSCSLRSSGDHV
ncbi:MAG: carbon-nitrogen hydrolase [Olpidium bornovanus]|uniref:Carbon-nitrogen hydrolase n=1 Tax=Olpidium bornovanus TaxID=278681 RepID=A0A8H7ZR15_9FUNG|nr:MAG: carbon-nitrogen hydrolase [Olpidium bornovanus]